MPDPTGMRDRSVNVISNWKGRNSYKSRDWHIL